MAQVFRFNSAKRLNDDNLFDMMVEDLELTPNELKYQHVSAILNDMTLCGIAYGEYVPLDAFKSGKITCPDCIAIINFCSSLKKGKDY